MRSQKPTDGEQFVPFVQLEFTRDLGPEPGTYSLRESLDRLDPGLKEGNTSFNVLDISFIGQRAAEDRRRRRRGQRRARRVRSRPQNSALSIVRATFIATSHKIESRAAGRQWLERIQTDAALRRCWRHAAIAAINCAIRGCRIGTCDPYLIEVREGDLQSLRYGFGQPPDVMRGLAVDAAVDRDDRALQPRAANAHPVVAQLAGQFTPLQAEDVIIRSRIDLDHQRGRAAALALHAGVLLAVGELDAQRGTQPQAIEAHGEATFRLAEIALTRPLTEQEHQRVASIGEEIAAELARTRQQDPALG
jgi:hypothetical protein